MTTLVTKKHPRADVAMIARAKHHAPRLLQFVHDIQRRLPASGFQQIHMSESTFNLLAPDGRKFKIRGIQSGPDRYKGLEIWRMEGRALVGRPVTILPPIDVEAVFSVLR